MSHGAVLVLSSGGKISDTNKTQFSQKSFHSSQQLTKMFFFHSNYFVVFFLKR